jgi:molecular chaperone HscB
MEAADTKRECRQCRAEVGAALVCPRCEAIQPLASGADLFAVLGLPRRLAVDVADLERRYLAASRAVHPDRHQTAEPRARELSLAASAVVNRAYRTLRDPVARGRYWLELYGGGMANDGAGVPPEIAAEVFETQEQLAELRAAAGPQAETLRRDAGAMRGRLADRLETFQDRLVASYGNGNDPAGPPIAELGKRLAEIAYLRRLLGDVEQALGE